MLVLRRMFTQSVSLLRMNSVVLRAYERKLMMRFFFYAWGKSDSQNMRTGLLWHIIRPEVHQAGVTSRELLNTTSTKESCSLAKKLLPKEILPIPWLKTSELLLTRQMLEQPWLRWSFSLRQSTWSSAVEFKPPREADCQLFVKPMPAQMFVVQNQTVCTRTTSRVFSKIPTKCWRVELKTMVKI